MPRLVIDDQDGVRNSPVKLEVEAVSVMPVVDNKRHCTQAGNETTKTTNPSMQGYRESRLARVAFFFFAQPRCKMVDHRK